MSYSRSDNQRFYDWMADEFRKDDTAVLRIKLEPGRAPQNIRQAMTQRGLYVSILKRAVDQPYMNICLVDPPPGYVAPTDTHQQQQLAGAAERKAFRAHVRAQGLDPDEMGIGGPEDDQ